MALVVADSSFLVALLLEPGPAGTWAVGQIAAADLAAPELVLFETANVARRLEATKRIGRGEAEQAHADLLALPIALWPYAVLADRAWELRRNLTSYDASYVALAELLEAPLLTLDRKIGKVRGLRCEVRVP